MPSTSNSTATLAMAMRFRLCMRVRGRQPSARAGARGDAQNKFQAFETVVGFLYAAPPYRGAMAADHERAECRRVFLQPLADLGGDLRHIQRVLEQRQVHFWILLPDIETLEHFNGRQAQRPGSAFRAPGNQAAIHAVAVPTGARVPEQCINSAGE